MRIFLPNTSDDCIAVDVLPKPEIPGLKGTQSEHHNDVEDLGKQGFGPGLERVWKNRDVFETSVHADIRTEAQEAEIFWNRYNDNVCLLISEIDFSLAGNDGVGCIEVLNVHS